MTSAVGSSASRVFLLLLSIGLALALAETLARWAWPAPEPELATAEGGFDWRAPAPYVVFHATPDADVHIAHGAWVRLQVAPGGTAHVVTDRHGFRYAGDLDLPKQPGERRVFLTGGSVAIAGLRNDTTICGFLEPLLARDHDGPVRCVTAGIMTAVSGQELAWLVHEISRLEPDLVISFSGFNDLVARDHFGSPLGTPIGWEMIEASQRDGLAAARRVRDELAALPLWQIALSRSRLATGLWPGLALSQQLTALQAREARDTHHEVAPEAAVERLLSNWDRMRAVTEAVGGRFLGVLQPFRPAERNDPERAPLYDRAVAAIAERAAAGAPYHSFDRLLDERAFLFFDPVHTVDAGNQVYAEALRDLIARESPR